MSKKWGEVGRGEREGEGVGEKKNIACSQSQTFRLTPLAHEAFVQFDWLQALQSNSDITNLAFMHKPTSGTPGAGCSKPDQVNPR